MHTEFIRIERFVGDLGDELVRCARVVFVVIVAQGEIAELHPLLLSNPITHPKRRSEPGRSFPTMTCCRRSSVRNARLEAARSTNCNPAGASAKSDQPSMFCVLIAR